MAAKRFLISFALAALMVATGCRSWCERHYCPQQPVAYQPCVPCCPPTQSYAPPAPVPTANWSQPGGRPCTCYCP
jgi:hypothetical protein